jgi:hypothetical protein
MAERQYEQSRLARSGGMTCVGLICFLSGHFPHRQG